MPAFERAVGLGYRYLETDVHATADGVVVAFHDDDLRRTCGRPGHISELPWREVATARVDGREPIPLLDDLLEALARRPRRTSTARPTGVVGPLADELAAAGALDRVCVGAFSDRRLARCADGSGRALCTSAGPVELGALRLARARPARRVLAVQVPVRWHGRHDRRRRGSSSGPTGGASRSTCGRSTTPPRWPACSTSASTGS